MARIFKTKVQQIVLVDDQSVPEVIFFFILNTAEQEISNAHK